MIGLVGVVVSVALSRHALGGLTTQHDGADPLVTVGGRHTAPSASLPLCARQAGVSADAEHALAQDDERASPLGRPRRLLLRGQGTERAAPECPFARAATRGATGQELGLRRFGSSICARADFGGLTDRRPGRVREA